MQLITRSKPTKSVSLIKQCSAELSNLTLSSKDYLDITSYGSKKVTTIHHVSIYFLSTPPAPKETLTKAPQEDCANHDQKIGNAQLPIGPKI